MKNKRVREKRTALAVVKSCNERKRNKQEWREIERQEDGEGDRAIEWVSPQFTGFLSCFQLVISAKGIKDEMNSVIWGECGRTVCLCVSVCV